MKMVIFANDSYFSYLLAEPVFREFHEHISMVVFSSRTTSSLGKIAGIYRKSYPGYFFYRSVVEVISRWNRRRGKKTIATLAERYAIKISSETDVNNGKYMDHLSADIGFAFNLDQIIKQELLDRFRHGILNVHASRLPGDKGISPALWAFARGEQSIWSSIYRMDAGLDTGPVYAQFSLPVAERDTAFSFYARLCAASGEKLAATVKQILENNLQPVPQDSNSSGTVWSWPDQSHRKMMVKSHRSFIRLQDIIKAIE
jgi:methionyl-tRNA formyltransferase